MPKSKSRKKKTPKRVLALPDLEQTKTAARARRDKRIIRIVGASRQRGYRG